MKLLRSIKDSQIVLRKFIMIISLCSLMLYSYSQTPKEQKFSIGVFYEQDIILRQYLTIGHRNLIYTDDGHGNAFRVLPSISRKSSLSQDFRLFSFTTGCKLFFNINNRFSINSGLSILMNEAYQPFFNNGSTHSYSTYQLDAYAAKYFRSPLGFNYLMNPITVDRKFNYSIGAGVCFDFLLHEEIYYYIGRASNKSDSFIFDRIVPYINFGLNTTPYRNFEIRYQLVRYFRSIYQHANREFYFKNSSLGFNFCLQYKFKITDHNKKH